MVDTISNMQLADLNSNPHGRKSLRDIIDRTIGICFYPPLVSEHYKLICLDSFNGSTKINNNFSKKDETKVMGIVLCAP